MALKVVLTRE